MSVQLIAEMCLCVFSAHCSVPKPQPVEWKCLKSDGNLSGCFTDLRERLTNLLFCFHGNDHVEPEEWEKSDNNSNENKFHRISLRGIGSNPTSRMCCQAKVIVIGLRVETISIFRR